MTTSKEWYIMQVLWENGACSLMEIVAQMERKTKWSKSTCATMLRRMTEKGVIGYEMKGKTKYFYPIVQKDEVIMPETKSFLGRIYDGSIGAMMSTLVKQGDLSEKDIDELEEILKNDDYKMLDFVCHFPVNMLIKNPYLLNDDECLYAMNPATHVDFLVYNRISKRAILAIEVDGYAFHQKETAQAKRYLLKIIFLNFIIFLY